MKDRDTQYRIAQNIAMACCFDAWIPGDGTCPLPATMPIVEYLERLIANARTAGAALEGMTPNHFGVTEETFFLTEAQIGKVRGDTFEAVCRAILWNSCVRHNATPSPSPSNVAILSLGDNYDLRRLFTEQSGRRLVEYMSALERRGVSLSYSTPDLVVLDVARLPSDVRLHFSEPIANLSIASQERMNRSRSVLEGLVVPEDFLFACGLKTSLRSDRMFQFLFEASAWKFIWRRVFMLRPCPYHSVTGRTFGANPDRLRSIDFSGLGGAGEAARAIDSVTQIATPVDLRNWFDVTLRAAVIARQSA